MSPFIAIVPPDSLYSQRFSGRGECLAVDKLRLSGPAWLPRTEMSAHTIPYQVDAEVTRYGCATGEVSR